MNKIKNRFTLAALAVVVAVAVAVGLTAMLKPDPAEAGGAVTNWYEATREDGTTAYTTAGGQVTAWDVSGYGSAVIHVVADASNTTSTLTIYPQYSAEPVACASVTDWFTGTDLIPYSAGTAYYVPISTQVNETSTTSLTSVGATTVTGSFPYVITSTYSYGSATQLAAAGGGYNTAEQSFTLTGDDYAGREFTVYGTCMRLNLDVSFGTITPTIYVLQRDIAN